MNISQLLSMLGGQSGNMLAQIGQQPQAGNMLQAAGAGGAVPPLPPARTVGPAPGASMPPVRDVSAPAAAPAAVRAPASEPGFMDRISARLTDPAMMDTLNDLFTGLASGRDFNSSISNAGLMIAQGGRERRDRAEVNQTRQAAIRMGLDPEAAKGFTGRELASFIISKQKGVEPTDDIREFQFAKQQGFGGSFEDWQTKKRGAGDEEFGLSPIYGTDAAGNAIIMQPSKKGGVKSVTLPDGVKLSTGIDKIDLGTQWALQDKKSGQVVGYMPKDVAGEATAKAAGAAQGEAKAGLPSAESSAQTAMETVDQLLADPNRESSTGGLDSFKGMIPGTSAYGYQKRVDQAKGQAFLAAMNTLRGTGAISEAEGSKATQALARLDTAQSDEDFKQALQEYRDIIARGLEVSRRKAGGGGAAASAPASAAPKRGVFDPATGTVKWQ